MNQKKALKGAPKYLKPALSKIPIVTHRPIVTISSHIHVLPHNDATSHYGFPILQRSDPTLCDAWHCLGTSVLLTVKSAEIYLFFMQTQLRKFARKG